MTHDYFYECSSKIDEVNEVSKKTMGDEVKEKSNQHDITSISVFFPFYDSKRWNIIQRALNLIKNSTNLTLEMLEDCIRSYTFSSMKFSAFELLFNGAWSYKSRKFFREVIPKMAELALLLPFFFTESIPLLLSSSNSSLTLTQQQASSILANAFFCTFPENVARKRFNCINFFGLFKMDFGSKKTEKLKCLLHYFERIVEFPPSGAITILRHSIEAPKWARIENRLSELYATSDGRIEDEGHGMLQVDFANKYIGGGVLNFGCVQEEIRFLICPELLVSCLVCERMEDNESILIVGAERYSNYTGYGDTFRWIERPYVPLTTRDDSGRSLSELVAIDALLYDRSEKLQFSIDCINRELKKAYSGFSVTVQGTREIATGNWGCGAFKGNLQLKSMIQLIAASAVQRPLRYFTFGNKNFAEELNQMVELLHNKNVTIGRLYKLLCEYGFFLSQSRTTLFEFLVQSLQDFMTQ